jgi:hypothetical protein
MTELTRAVLCTEHNDISVTQYNAIMKKEQIRWTATLIFYVLVQFQASLGGTEISSRCVRVPGDNRQGALHAIVSARATLFPPYSGLQTQNLLSEKSIFKTGDKVRQ